MYPLPDDTLSLSEIAKHWSRDLAPRPPCQEVLERLLQAVWNNQFIVRGGGGTQMTRVALLRLVGGAPFHPGIRFLSNSIALPLVIPELPPGGLFMDAAKEVYLPPEETWTPAIIEAACDTMSTCTINEYNADVVLPILKELDSTKEDFGAFCDACGFERPAFWFVLGSAAKARSFAGRPSVMRPIEAEMRRRASAQQLEPRLRHEALALHRWAKEKFENKQVPTPRAIENALREVHRQLRDRAKA